MVCSSVWMAGWMWMAGMARAEEGRVEETVEALVVERCASCHALGSGDKERWGPSLVGIMERGVGTEPGYRYGSYLRALREEGAVWDEGALRIWLVDSKRLAKAAGARTKMPAQHVEPNEVDRIIAHLWTLE